MSEKDDGGPVHPVIHRTFVNGSEGVVEGHSGMSLRDYFAAAALTGLLSAEHTKEASAKSAYAIADALLKARTQGE